MRTFITLSLLAGLAAGAAAGPAEFPSLGGHSVRLPITSIQQAKTGRTVLQQFDFSCGSAAIATLLSHQYGLPVTEHEVLTEMYAHGDQEKIQKEGFSMLDMKRFLETRGFAADGFQQTLDKLAEARLPAIVLINEEGYHHFVVVKGVQPGLVLVGDPARGARVLSREHFERVWVGGLLFVIHNHVDKARFNLAADWRSAPRAPLATGVPLDGVAGSGIPKLGPGDF